METFIVIKGKNGMEKSILKYDLKANLIKLFMVLSIVTSSFDIFLNIDLFGYNFRATQLLYLPILLMYVADTLKNMRLELPVGGRYILSFAILQAVFMFRSPDFTNAVQYELYLLYNIAIVFSITFYADRYFSTEWILSVYLNSFTFVALFGLIQFILYPFHINLLVVQYWINSLARINGFSYEPSYFSTYLLMGFVLCAYLIEKKQAKTINALFIKFIIITVAIILSTSRMGWLMIALWVIFRLLNLIKKNLLHGTSKKGGITMIAWIVIVVLLFSFLVVYAIFNFEKIKFLFQGLGIGGTAAHSANDRIGGLVTCINIWKEKPFLGYSLGGVDPIVAQSKNMNYIIGNNGVGTSLIGELLVAGGIIGVLLFIFYIKKLYETKRGGLVQSAFVWALMFELAILCMNQNILRPYVWYHVGILSGCFKSHENESKQ